FAGRRESRQANRVEPAVFAFCISESSLTPERLALVECGEGGIYVAFVVVKVDVRLPAEALQLRQCLAEEIEISFVDKITPGVRAVDPNRHRRAVRECAETRFALPQQQLA